MNSISAPAHALLGSDAVAHVWTANPDGSPQVSVVWVLVQDDKVVFGTDASSIKVRNLRMNPRLILSIEDEERNERGYQRHLIIHGQATLVEGRQTQLMDRLAMKYLGIDRHPLALRDSQTAVSVHVDVERISGLGPWVPEVARR